MIATLALAGCNQLLGLDPVSDRDGGAAPIDARDDDRDGAPVTDATAADAGPSCGDGHLDADEECDDGNGASDDGCSPSCKLELHIIGCADGEREGFDLEDFAAIAACGGTWTIPGIAAQRTGVTDCGDDGGSSGCNSLDLCASGWHVCSNRLELVARLGGAPCTVGNGFYATYQVGTTSACLEPGRVIYGCGDIGTPTSACAPFTLHVGVGCSGVPGWSCNDEDESTTLLHHSNGGGVLCCK